MGGRAVPSGELGEQGLAQGLGAALLLLWRPAEGMLREGQGGGPGLFLGEAYGASGGHGGPDRVGTKLPKSRVQGSASRGPEGTYTAGCGPCCERPGAMSAPHLGPSSGPAGRRATPGLKATGL